MLRELLEAASLWRKTKGVYLAASDSKTTPEGEVAAARKEHLRAVERLDRAVEGFEKLLVVMKRTKRGPKKPIPWKQLLDSAAVALTTLSKATNVPGHPLVEATVIDQSRVIDMPVDK
jgi:hypothetical protein